MVALFECRLCFENSVHSKRLLEIRDFLGPDLERDLLQFNRFEAGATKFHYPRVQFKIIENMAYLIALEEAASFLQAAEANNQVRIQLPDEITMSHCAFESRIEPIGLIDSAREYKFATPWLALNDRNFNTYTQSRSKQNRNEELHRILVGNCFSLINGLAIPLDGRIELECGKMTSVKASVNGRGQIGFLGTFRVNLHLANFIGLGKSVSRGFGSVVALPARVND